MTKTRGRTTPHTAAIAGMVVNGPAIRKAIAASGLMPFPKQPGYDRQRPVFVQVHSRVMLRIMKVVAVYPFTDHE